MNLFETCLELVLTLVLNCVDYGFKFAGETVLKLDETCLKLFCKSFEIRLKLCSNRMETCLKVFETCLDNALKRI